jgi:hypothetical protein
MVKEELFGIGTRGAVSNVLGRVLVHGTTILFRPSDHAAQFYLPRF